jgi:hypothetical protein
MRAACFHSVQAQHEIHVRRLKARSVAPGRDRRDVLLEKQEHWHLKRLSGPYSILIHVFRTTNSCLHRLRKLQLAFQEYIGGIPYTLYISGATMSAESIQQFVLRRLHRRKLLAKVESLQ